MKLSTGQVPLPNAFLQFFGNSNLKESIWQIIIAWMLELGYLHEREGGRDREGRGKEEEGETEIYAYRGCDLTR